MLLPIHYFSNFNAFAVYGQASLQTNRNYANQLLIKFTCPVMNALHWTHVSLEN